MRGGAENGNCNDDGLPRERLSPAHGSRLRNVKKLLGLWMERDDALVRSSRPRMLGPPRAARLSGSSARRRVETRCARSRPEWQFSVAPRLRVESCYGRSRLERR